MKMTIRLLPALTAALLVPITVASVSSASAAEDFPTKPISFIVPYSAGGSTDVSARILSERASAILGQPITIINRPGAAGAVGLAELARAPADGYTIGTFNAITNAIAPHMQEVPYDPVADFDPVVLYGGYISFVAVQDEKPWQTLDDMMQFAKDNPGALTIGVSGIGATTHLGLARLLAENDAEATFVPFGGGAPVTASLLGGHIAVAGASNEVVPHARAGAVRLLGIMQNTNLEEFPDVKNFRELGYDWDVNSWLGVAAPAGTNPAALEKLQMAFAEAANSEGFKSQMKDMQLIHYSVDVSEATNWIETSYAEFGEVVKSLKIGLYAE